MLTRHDIAEASRKCDRKILPRLLLAFAVFGIIVAVGLTFPAVLGSHPLYWLTPTILIGAVAGSFIIRITRRHAVKCPACGADILTGAHLEPIAIATGRCGRCGEAVASDAVEQSAEPYK